MKTPSEIATDLRLFAKYHLVRRVYDYPAREEELGVALLDFETERYGEALAQAASDFFEMRTVDHAEYDGRRFPLHFLRTGREGASKTLLVLGGVHGNEHAGLLAIPTLLERVREGNIAPDVELRILTPVNAVGAAEGSRYNGDGFDINRDFVRFETKEARAVRQVFEERRPDFMISLHEGPQEGSFLFSNRLVDDDLAARLLDRMAAAGVDLATVDYFGRTLDRPGHAPMNAMMWRLNMIWAATLKMKATGVWAEEQGVPEITLESSWRGLDGMARQRAHLELVLGVLDALGTG
jgi:hypothetical protein